MRGRTTAVSSSPAPQNIIIGSEGAIGKSLFLYCAQCRDDAPSATELESL